MEADGKPARSSQEQEPRFCSGGKKVSHSAQTQSIKVQKRPESGDAEGNPSVDPDRCQTHSGISPQPRRLGSSTGPEETKTGGRRRDSELQDEQ